MEYVGISIVYIFKRFFFRIYYFLYHWYVRGFQKTANWTMNQLEKFDYAFAVKINLQNIFQPLYQDYSFLGYVLGFILRSFRILVAMVFYISFSIVCFLGFMVWAATPIFAVYQIIVNFPH